MTNVKFIELRPAGWDKGSLFLSWQDANESAREIARRLVPLRGPLSYTVTVEWADTVKMSVTFDIDTSHAADPAPLSTEMYDALFASTGDYDFGPTSVEGHA